MSRDDLIDIIRDELKRQQRDRKVSLVPVETPDKFDVIGIIDVHALADAIARELPS
ncbi:hypothetical protein ABIF68_006363 [Bradyrhizobium japonicum]|uniref:Uncharacterized protein n=1 Tax=Bradyrhizobium barranii subsp. barranii TaxID=2823807 RepID=A0A939MAD3_9BRAD|nr:MULTISPECIES: hypothetical protein [Bradyrhizobium]UEM17030.1 hypothetical protein J4G43_024070 [Bradyrhizobium barranii subsp. barranii]